LKPTVIYKRGDSADILVESPLYDYTFVADAKVFRMSRTAKNPKDFKVVALSGWRQNYDFAVLCAPMFQYPKSYSQIYAQSIEYNVCLFSWELLICLIRCGIKENKKLSFSSLWNFGKKIALSTVVADKKRNFLDEYYKFLLSVVKISDSCFSKILSTHKSNLVQRGVIEKECWEFEKLKISSYNKEKAISELIVALKIEEKIIKIQSYLEGLLNA
jgi:type II restriction enzyme